MDSSRTSRMQNLNDYNTLTDEFRTGANTPNREQFGSLVMQNTNSAMKVAMSILRDKCEAEDAVQSAFAKAYEHLGQFQGDAKFSTWLTRIVVNQCLMRLRQMRRAKLLYIEEAVAPGEKITFELPDERTNAEDAICREEIARLLRTEIKRTPPLLRRVFELRDVEQRPMPEVAEELGISVAAAKSRLLRARAELRRRMLRHAGVAGPATLTA